MKKLLVVCAMLCAAFGAQAQEENQVEIKAGVGLSSLVGKDVDCKQAISYKLGVGYNVNFSESWGIEPAVMFAQKGVKADVDGAETINRYFIEVPVLAAYKLSLNDNMKLIINAGPYAAYGIAGSDDWYKGDVANEFEVGLQAGAKVAFNKISVGLEYQRAFTKAIDKAKAYTSGFGLTVGYAF